MVWIQREKVRHSYISHRVLMKTEKAVPLSVTFAKKKDKFTVYAKVLGFFCFPRSLGACLLYCSIVERKNFNNWIVGKNEK